MACWAYQAYAGMMVINVESYVSDGGRDDECDLR